MALVTIWPNWKIKKINDNVDYKKSHLLKDTNTLIRKQESLNKQIKTTKSKLDQINRVLGSYHETNWSDLLNDIGKRIPRIARITNLSNRDGSGVSIEGQALSNEAVYLFADMLNESEYITSATIAETNRDKNGLIRYEIYCSLDSIKRNSNVD
jgi:Tfp pilus assembly protein PilN